MTQNDHELKGIIDVKVVAVGDPTSGKTSLLWSLIDRKHQGFEDPLVFQNHTSMFKADGSKFRISLSDTAGQEDFSRIRTLAYDCTHVFLLVFSLDQESTFLNARNKWYPQLKRHYLDVPVIFVGKMADEQNNIQGPTCNTLNSRQVRRVVEKQCSSVYVQWSKGEGGTSITKIYSEIVRLRKESECVTVQSDFCSCNLI